jgi:peptidoglycan/xylan/chitin deacetylase (PgdA/CDA1 family)
LERRLCVGTVRELILTFHGLGEPPPDADAERDYWVPVEWLEAILDALPPHGVRVTFDDGNVTDVEHALPLLAACGRVADFFVVAGRVDQSRWLSSAQLLELRDAGMRIGSHGLSHEDWRTLSDAALSEDLVASRRRLESIVGGKLEEAACPYGSYDRRVLSGLRAAGYRRVYTSDEGTASTTAWLTPRTSVHRRREIDAWLELVAAGPQARPDVTRLARRLVKRLR